MLEVQMAQRMGENKRPCRATEPLRQLVHPSVLFRDTWRDAQCCQRVWYSRAREVFGSAVLQHRQIFVHRLQGELIHMTPRIGYTQVLDKLEREYRQHHGFLSPIDKRMKVERVHPLE